MLPPALPISSTGWIGSALSLYVVWKGKRMGADHQILQRMLGNVAVEALVGRVPLAGDLFDTVFKADLRNIGMMEKALASRLGSQ
ncbi:DUF4112 domain-containing protein [Gluconobacter kanchanaburiensis]|nr:DUF4112 domain-containing protein [Gluconobacter kanchanaburiensis]MBF0860741.1 DUF4112 domain-containing protein [Gluconobacter kanchanaburiensis]